MDACPYAAQCYHGGLNIAFALGLSPEGRELIDVDLKSAYTTALALIQIPDWNSARRTFSLGDLAVTEEEDVRPRKIWVPERNKIPEPASSRVWKLEACTRSKGQQLVHRSRDRYSADDGLRRD